MPPLSDFQIERLIERGELVIDPFYPMSIKGHKKASFGLTTSGYDLMLAPELCEPYTPKLLSDKELPFGAFSDEEFEIFDRKCVELRPLPIEQRGDEMYYVMRPNSIVLGRSVEHIKMPRNVMGIALNKSTLARAGMFANVTPLEAGWEGFLTIEVTNFLDKPNMLYVNEGIIQILFFHIEDPDRSYVERGGRYQNQVGVVASR